MSATRREATPTRRDQHVADTRKALVDAARQLFTEQGYAATGTEEIVAAAGVTRGALYHHFRDKSDLFRAVMEQVAREVAENLINSGLGGASGAAWTEIRAGLSAFLDLCVVTDDFQRIVLVEGPVVLGHEAWDDLVARHGSNLLAEWLSRAISEGSIAPVPVEPLIRLLIAMIAESSLYIARADDRAAARQVIGVALDRLLQGLSTVNDVPLCRELSGCWARRTSTCASRRAGREYPALRAFRSGIRVVPCCMSCLPGWSTGGYRRAVA